MRCFLYLSLCSLHLACADEPTSSTSPQDQALFTPLPLDQGSPPFSEPLAGEQGGEPLAGAQGGEPLAGEQGGEPLAGAQGGEPLAGAQGGEPLAGAQGGEPLAGAQGGELAGEEPQMSEPEWVNVCRRWREVEAQIERVTWSGDVAQCAPGDVNQGALQSVLELTNLYRSLADLQPVSLQSNTSEALQRCALMMEANNTLNHSPPSTWRCYDDEGARMAGQSNLAGSDAIDAMGMYMVDPGNQSTMGHRRWLMSPGLETIGVGSTESYSCMQVLHLNRSPGWTAFPPSGPFPLQLTQDRWRRSVDQTGWTLQYDGLRLSNPQASVTAYELPDPEGAPVGEGVDQPVELVTLLPNYGSSAALNLVPQGWRAEAGKRYVVRITGGDQVIEYSVDMVDCDSLP